MLTEQHYQQAVAFVRKTGNARISALQRHLHLGYYQAACLMDRLEENRIVSSPDATGTRHVLPIEGKTS